MKKLQLAVTIAAALLLATGVAQANDKNHVGNQNLSKRPYHQLPDEAAYNKGNDWEGATLVKEQDRAEAGPTQYQRLRINMLGKQPYMEGKAE